MSETALHPRPSPGRAVAGLAVFTVAVVLVATIGGLAATSSAAQYQTLDLPTWAPPAAVFGPVWTVLYAMIAIAGWLVWRRRGVVGAPGAFAVYAVQLALNALWTPLFFGMGAIGGGVRRDLRPVDHGRHDDRAVRPAQPVGGRSPRALPGLGDVRRGAQRGHLATQLTSVAAPYVGWRRPRRPVVNLCCWPWTVPDDKGG